MTKHHARDEYIHAKNIMTNQPELFIDYVIEVQTRYVHFIDSDQN